MCARRAVPAKPDAPPEALKRFLKRTLKEQSTARDSLTVDSVHDLRVALRRCRTLAEGFAKIDPHGDWRRMRKAAKELQDGLAELRDAQVMAGRVRRLHLTDGDSGAAVTKSLERDQRKGDRKAESALKGFGRKHWKRWKRRLPKAAARLCPAPAVFAHLVLERAKEAAVRERRWRGSGSQTTAHSLRIAVKHFRYTVQSFLPDQYAPWEKTLKRMQDALGDMHDLDVLRVWLLKVAKKEALDHQNVKRWLDRVAAEREACVERYKKAVAVHGKHEDGRHLLWERWRREIEQLAGISGSGHEESSA